MRTSSVKKILIVRFSSIGDIVLTTPVIRCLKQQLQGVEIHYLTKNIYRQLLEGNKYIDKIYGIDKNILAISAMLKAENYDLIVDLHKNLRSLGVYFLLSKPKISFRKLNILKWLLVNMRTDFLPRIHIVDRYMNPLKKLGIKNDGKGLDFFIQPGSHEEIAKALPAKFNNGYYCIAIGSKQTTKMMPYEKLLALCNELHKPVVLLGGRDDEETGKKIASASSNNVFNACNVFSLGGSAAAIQNSEALITPDTGMMHIAAALKKKVISVWGSTVPAFGMYPYYPPGKENYYIIENNDLICRPCSKLGYRECPEKHFKCMNDIDLNKIFSLLD